MKKVVFLLVATILLTTVGTTTNADALVETTKLNSQLLYTNDINFSNSDNGVVGVYFNNREEKKMKLVVQKGDQRYIYNVFNNEEYVNYPLQLGDGMYTVSLYENTTGTKYRKLSSKSFNVNLEDENNVYLQSVLEISWDVEDESIVLAETLVSEALEAKQEEFGEEAQLSDNEKIDLLYNYVVNNIDYDYEKIKGLDYSYVPNNDVTVEDGTGICYDYSSLLASMLRSQGIPTKMAKGYSSTSDVYHAWNEVYLSDEERWVVVDTTFDAYMAKNSYTYDFEKSESNYNKVKEF